MYRSMNKKLIVLRNSVTFEIYVKTRRGIDRVEFKAFMKRVIAPPPPPPHYIFLPMNVCRHR